MKTKHMKTLPSGNSISRSPLPRPRARESFRSSFSEGGSLITSHYSLLTVLVFALTCLALSPTPNAFGVLPPPDGGYPNFNTAEGDNALFSLTTGSANTAIGEESLFQDTTGSNNTAIGTAALGNNTTGDFNTASGFRALVNNTTATFNTGTGAFALQSNTTGNENTANGASALEFNTTGAENTANGAGALESNTTGFQNTATGTGALNSNTSGNHNTANGYQALFSNTTGVDNIANGFNALYSNTTGSSNTANGAGALYNNTTGSSNTANGANALLSNTTGLWNTANGINALYLNTTGVENTANGALALVANTTGNNNIAFGVDAGINLTTGDNNIDIGNRGVAAEANTVRIGTQGTQTKTFMAGIYGTAISGTPVKINSSGQLGVAPSSARFKQNVHKMDKASDVLLALRPVTFRYKPEIDPEGSPQFGLVAEEVEKVNPALVARDAEGKVFTVRYEAVNAMLLNEFLKEHKKVEDLEKDLRATIVQQQKEIEALTTGLQKVSAQLELRNPAPQTVANNQ